MRWKDESNLLLFLLNFVFIKNVQSKAAAVTIITTTSVSNDKNYVTRVPPPPLYTMPPVHFDGPDYEDKRHVKHRYHHLWRDGYYDRKESWRCWYEKLRCIRYQRNSLQICTSDIYRLQYSFVNICEMEYYNCVLEYPRFFYGGDEKECWYIWDVHLYNHDNEVRKKDRGYYYDTTDSWWKHGIVVQHPYNWRK